MGCFTTPSEEDPEVQQAKKEVDSKEEGFQGPLKRRSCKDVFWLLLFCAFWGGMLAVAGKAFADGDPDKFLSGQDSWANVCGKNNQQLLAGQNNSGLDLTDRPFLYNTQPSKENSILICVAECPTVADPGTLECDPTTQNCLDAGVCLGQGPYTISSETTADDAANSGCPPSIYNARALTSFYKVCYPTSPTTSISSFFIAAADSVVSSVNSFELVTEALGDLEKARLPLLYSGLIAVGLCFTLIVLTRCFTWPIVWLSILGTNGVLVACAYLSGSRYFDLRSEFNAHQVNGTSVLADPNLETKVNWYMGLFIASTIVAGIVALLTLALRSRIGLAIQLIKLSAEVIVKAPMLLLQPLWTYVWIIAMVAFWATCTLWLATSRTAVLNSSTGHADYVQIGYFQEMFGYFLFGTLWTIQFFSACSQIVIAGTIANWYFSRDRGMCLGVYFASYGNLLRYHMGSAAAGSLIIAIVQFVRITLEYFSRKAKAEGAGPIAEFFFKCLGCCLWCFEKCLKFLNKNAYIEIAIYGYSFCTAAREAFKVIFRNIIRMAVLNLISWFVFFIIKLLVAGGAMLASYILIQNVTDIAYPGAIVLVSGVIAYIIADVFVGVFDMTIDTLFVCFAEDNDKNASKGKEPFAPRSLVSYMNKNKMMKSQGDKKDKDKGKDKGKDKDKDEEKSGN